MKNSDPDSKIVVGALIGGLVGMGALAIFLAVRKKESSLEHVGKVMSNMGEILESHHIEEPGPVKDFGKKLHKNEDTLGAVVDWIAAGISLWKKIKS